MQLFVLITKTPQPWSVTEKQGWMRWLFYQDEWQILKTIHCIFFHIQSPSLSVALSLSLTHKNTNQRTSAITPEITSLIDISITLCHSCVLSCLTHTPPIPILNCSMDAQTRNEVTLLLFFLPCGAPFHRTLYIKLFRLCDFHFIFICLNVCWIREVDVWWN